MLRLKLITLIKKPDYTEGVLFNQTDNTFICDTLEDAIRFQNHEQELNGAALKIQDKTAIPGGLYDLIVRYSPSFLCNTVMLKDVPYFSYILMHYGRTVKNSSGCILVGEKNGDGQLKNTGMTKKLVDLLKTYPDGGMISISR